MKSLLIVTVVFEGFTGITLIAVPAFFVGLLLGVHIDETVTTLLCRLTGCALISLALVCQASIGNSQIVHGILKALIFYNVAAASLLIYSWSNGFFGIALFPAAMAHIALAVWCLVILMKRK